MVNRKPSTCNNSIQVSVSPINIEAGGYQLIDSNELSIKAVVGTAAAFFTPCNELATVWG